MFKKIRRYLKEPKWALGCDLIKTHPNWLSDKLYVQTIWRMVMGYKLDLDHPQTFNEKLQWLKLYDHNPLYTTLVDKYRVKDWVAALIGKEHIIPTLAVYDSVDEIDLNKLPDQFVLKCNHDSGSVYVCKDKLFFDISSIKHKLDQHIQHNFYWDAREWAYKNVERKIFAETYMQDDHFEDLVTYKFLCFDGKPEVMYATVKTDDIWENYYDMSFNMLPIRHGRRTSTTLLDKPTCFDKMITIARKLSQGMTHVRIDLYEVKGVVYFSEFTFYDWGGLIKFDNSQWDHKLGEMIKLPINND